MTVINKFTLLKRRADLTEAQYLAYWRSTHAAVLATLPAFWKHNTRYIQNHRLPLPASLGAEPFWDGIATTEQRPRADMSVGLYDEPSYMEVVRPDELNFLSIDDATAIYAKQHVIQDGPRDGVKFISFMRRNPKLTHAQFLDHWFNVHAPLVQQVAPFWRRVRRYVQNHGIPELSRPMTSAGKVATFAGVAELWFDSVEEAQAAFAEPEFVKIVGPDEAKFMDRPNTRFVVRENNVPRPAEV